MPTKSKEKTSLKKNQTTSKNLYSLTANDWMFAHNVRDGTNAIPPQDNLVVIVIWNDQDHKIIVESEISQQIEDGVDARGDAKYRDEHRRKFDGKIFPLTLLVPYNLSGNHFEIAVIKLSDRQTATNVKIYNNNSDESYNQLKDILCTQLQIQNLPDVPDKTFKCTEATESYNLKQAIQCKDGRCGDAVIAIARLKARGVLASYENLAGEPYYLDTKDLSHTQIFDALREKHFEGGLCEREENHELSASEESDTEAEAEKFKTPEKQIIRSAQQSPYEKIDIKSAIKTARENSSRQFKSSITSSPIGTYAQSGTIPKNKQVLRQVSGSVDFRVIEISENNTSSARTVKKNSGYDENFRLEKKEQWKTTDTKFQLEKSPNFKTAFGYSRLPTNSYIHFRGESQVVTGHPGGFFKSLSDLPAETSQADKLGNTSHPDYSINRRKSSDSAIQTLKSTKGENKVGSVGNSEDCFHGKRQGIIDRVINEAAEGNDAKLKQQSPIKATVEALKFVINDTVGHKDNTSENQEKFKGITTDGLNLEDEIQREYALKHYQGARDVMKLGVLKHDERLNEADSDGEAATEDGDLPKEINRINRKLARTKLEEKYHGKTPEAKRNLSPLRYSSPYSRAVVDATLEEFKNARSYEEIATVYATPVPVITPTENLVRAEEEKRKLLTDPGPTRNIIPPTRSRVQTEPSKTNKTSDLDKTRMRQPVFDEPEPKLPPKTTKAKQIISIKNSTSERKK